MTSKTLDSDFFRNYEPCGVRGYSASPPPHIRARCTASKGHTGMHHDGTWAQWADDHSEVVALNEREQRVREHRERRDTEAAAQDLHRSMVARAVATVEGAVDSSMSWQEAAECLAAEVRASSIWWQIAEARAEAGVLREVTP